MNGRHPQTLSDQVLVDRGDQTISSLAIREHRSPPAIPADYLDRGNLFTRQGMVVDHLGLWKLERSKKGGTTGDKKLGKKAQEKHDGG